MKENDYIKIIKIIKSKKKKKGVKKKRRMLITFLFITQGKIKIKKV